MLSIGKMVVDAEYYLRFVAQVREEYNTGAGEALRVPLCVYRSTPY